MVVNQTLTFLHGGLLTLQSLQVIPLRKKGGSEYILGTH